MADPGRFVFGIGQALVGDTGETPATVIGVVQDVVITIGTNTVDAPLGSAQMFPEESEIESRSINATITHAKVTAVNLSRWVGGTVITGSPEEGKQTHVLFETDKPEAFALKLSNPADGSKEIWSFYHCEINGDIEYGLHRGEYSLFSVPIRILPRASDGKLYEHVTTIADDS